MTARSLQPASGLCPRAFALVAACACALGAPSAAAQDSWREALERFERDLDELFDGLTGAEQVPAPAVGLFVPAGPTPRDAAALPRVWQPLHAADAPPSRMVLLIHGLDEPGDIWMDLGPELVRAGHAVVRFEYPNDQRIRSSSGLFLEHLRHARAAGIEEIAIVAHSMGGLVSFDALTRPDGYAGDTDAAGLPRVTRLITVGTPWNGSPLAGLQPLSELREQVARLIQEGSFDPRPLLDYRRDGSGQADDDLRPDSPLMLELAERAWPEGLPHTVIAGRLTRPDDETLEAITESALLRELFDESDLEAFASDLETLSETVGDGVVPLASATARPAEMTYVFAVNHRTLVRRSPIDFVTGGAEDGPPGIPVILETLARDDPSRTDNEPDGDAPE